MISVYVKTVPPSGERYDVTVTDIQNLFDEIQTPSLFGDKKTFVLTNVFEDETIKKNIIERLSESGSSPHDVIMVTDSILAADIKKFEKFAKIHKLAEKEKKESAFNAFALANAFATGDKKKTWLTFQEVLIHEDEMEKVHGMIWWKLKDMVGKRGVFSKEQLNVMAQKLVSVYHESRLGGMGMQERLEEFFLTLPEIKNNYFQ
jgi:hypothetical protein